MKKRFGKTVLALLLSIAMVIGMFSTVAFAAEGETSPTYDGLYAGAGVGTINFPEAMLPNSEGLTYVDEAPHARIMLLESNVKVAIVAMELVNTPETLITQIKTLINEKTGIPVDNIWVSSSHAFCTPHQLTDGEYFDPAVMSAVETALDQAIKSLKPATFGVTTTQCDANVNNQMTVGGKAYDNIQNADGTSDHTITIMKAADLDGNTIGIMYSYGIRSSCADVPRNTSDRYITPDLTGEACLDLEEKYGVPVLYLNSAAADQMPTEVAYYNKVSEDGTKVESVWNAETGIKDGLAIAEKMGEKISTAIEGVVEDMKCEGKGVITVGNTSFNWDNTAGDAQVNIPVSTLTIDDLALVGVKTELCAETALELKEASPYEYTCALTFVNGDQSYMPSADTYENNQKVSTKSSLKVGAAEEMVKVAVDELNKNFLLAGAGVGTINFPSEMLPNSEGLTYVDEAPHARVMLIQHDIKIAIVALELVNTPDNLVTAIKNLVSEKTGTPVSNVWVSSTHAFCTPHQLTDGEYFDPAVMSAVETALDQACESLTYATFGVTSTQCNVNVNNQMTVGGKAYDNIQNADGTSDHTLTVMKFQDLDGKTIGMMYSYGIRSSCADVPRNTSGRYITPDLTGEACLDLEETYGVPVLYLNSAAADQMPTEVAYYNKLSEDGTKVESVWNAETGIQEGLALAEKMGEKIADAVESVATDMKCDGEGIIGHAATSYDWDNTSGDAQINIPVEVITIDGLAMAAVKTELCAETAITLRSEALKEGYDYAVALTFVNGDQSYMPAASTYEAGQKVSTKSSLKAGAAEKFVEVATEYMKDENLERTNVTNEEEEEDEKLPGTDAESVGTELTIGGKTWVVLAEVDGKQLVIAKDVISVGAYNQTGGTATWENSSIREYLNGEFYNSFTDAEKARIVETTNTNDANPTYAAGKGADTQDKVFLLSLSEAKGYFASDAARAATTADGTKTTWWLRTTGKDTAFAATVNLDGSIYSHGGVIGQTDSSSSGDSYEPAGIRPAMWISKSASYTVAADGVQAITKVVVGQENTSSGPVTLYEDSDTYDSMFKCGDAEQGLKELLDAGKVTINGAVMAPTTDPATFSINGGESLWKNEDGTWGWNTHKLFGSDGYKDYAECAIDFINGVSLLRGITYTLGLDENGYIVSFDATVWDVAMADTVDVAQDGSVKFTIVAEPTAKMDVPKPSPADQTFTQVLKTPKAGDEVLYWYDAAAKAWTLTVADSQEVELVITSSGATINGEEMIDSRLTLHYSPEAFRPSQPVRTLRNAGIEKVKVIQWTAPGVTVDGSLVTVGFSAGDQGKAYLESAVAEYEDVLENITVSDNGAFVYDGTEYVSQSAYDTFAKAVAAAKAVLATETTQQQYTNALYTMTAAYGTFKKAVKEGSCEYLYTYEDNADGMYADETVTSLLGTDAEARVEELLNAGNVYVNGKALPTSETDTAALSETDARGDSVKGFAINGLVSFYNTADGWIQTVHKATSAATTFTAARAAFVEGVSKMTGLTMDFYDLDGDGKCDVISADVKEVLRVDSFTQAADGTVKISRGNFTLGNRAGSLEINDIASFSKENWDESIEAGDMIYYWQEGTEWHAQKADCTTGLLTDGKDHGYYIFNGVKYTDCNMTKYYLITGNRPGQFLMAHLYLGLTDEEVNMWTAGDTYPFGFTSVDPAGSLTKAISNVQARLESAVVSADGNGVIAGKYYVTSEADGNAVEAAVVAAQKVLADEKSSAADLDLAIYNLYNSIKDKLLEGSSTFSDITGCSAGVQKAINWAADNGIVNGVGDNKFDPYSYCTRAQMAVMLYRLAGKPDVSTEAIEAAKEKFSDVESLSWGVLKAVAWAVSEGIINGYKDGTFRPEDSITRASTVVMLWRMAGKPEVRAAAKFTDTDNCSAGVMKAINWAASVGITKGSANGDGTYRFAPEDACQRQHIATFVYRYSSVID